MPSGLGGEGAPWTWDRISGSNHGQSTNSKAHYYYIRPGSPSARQPVGLARLAYGVWRFGCLKRSGQSSGRHLTGEQGPKVYAYGRRKDASCSMSSIKPICDDEWTAARVFIRSLNRCQLSTATCTWCKHARQATASNHIGYCLMPTEYLLHTTSDSMSNLYPCPNTRATTSMPWSGSTLCSYYYILHITYHISHITVVL